MSENDTIAAVATALGLSGIGVVRVSGPGLVLLIKGVVGKTLPARQAVLANFRDGKGELIDQGIALFFPAPHSYTGEDVLELQGHGGPIVQQQLLKRCLELGARLARPGEFTQRAYLNDKLDLAQAESVADLIGAATVEAARSALRSLQGAFSDQVEELVRALIQLRTRVEATLDFPEEEIEFIKEPSTNDELAAVRERLQSLLAHSRQGSLLREGIHVVLAGQPNVGKSSLLNRLAGEELAIVTEFPGTTRDAIRQSLNLEGIPVHIIDTAGLRDSGDPVERIGIERTWVAIEKADLVLLVMDATQGEQPEDQAILQKLPASLPCLKVMNKIDLVKGLEAHGEGGRETIWLSAKTGVGISRLQRILLDKVGWQGGEGLFMARERHVQALQQAWACLERAGHQAGYMELYAEELRHAQEQLGSITGEFTSDDLLGEIFSRFCIGK